MHVSDGEVGAMALFIARKNPESPAPRLLSNAVSLTVEEEGEYTGWHEVLYVRLPLDFYELWTAQVASDVTVAAQQAGFDVSYSNAILGAEAEDWRDRLAQLEDWGPETEPSGTWEVIDNRLTDLKGLLDRALTPDQLSDVGKRCRDLLIASASATYRQSMLPNGEDPPKEADAKTKCRYIVAAHGTGSTDKSLVKLIERAWELANALAHNPDPSSIAAFASAQATILVVRTLERIEATLD